MKKGVYYTLIILSVMFLLITVGGGWYLVITQETLPTWIGNVVSAYTGGLFGLFGMFVRDWLNHRAMRRQRWETMRFTQVKEAKAFLGKLQGSLNRLHMFVIEKQKGRLLSGIAPSEEEIDALWQQYEEMLGLLDMELRHLLEEVLLQGLLILKAREYSVEDIIAWNTEYQRIAALLDQMLKE